MSSPSVSDEYVHGHSERESARLQYQASKLASLLHRDTRYGPGEIVLEVACGVGAQTEILAHNSPHAEFTCIDISDHSLAAARARLRAGGFSNVRFQQADVYSLPFSEPFDHVFVCFLLEHLPNPSLALRKLKEVLKPGGTVTVIEGDHGSALFHPESPYARQVIQCLVTLQAQRGGNALIGRELGHLLTDAGYSDVRVSPRQVYADARDPEAREGVKNIFIAMIEGVREQSLSAGLVTEEDWEKGISDLYRTTVQDGAFCYTFFKAVGEKER